MNQLDAAFALNAEGRFSEALAALDHSDPDPNSQGYAVDAAERNYWNGQADLDNLEPP